MRVKLRFKCKEQPCPFLIVPSMWTQRKEKHPSNNDVREEETNNKNRLERLLTIPVVPPAITDIPRAQFVKFEHHNGGTIDGVSCLKQKYTKLLCTPWEVSIDGENTQGQGGGELLASITVGQGKGQCRQSWGIGRSPAGKRLSYTLERSGYRNVCVKAQV